MKIQKKKILHITQALGGIKSHIQYIFEYCNCENIEFILIAPYDEELDFFCKKLVIKYYTIKWNRNFNLFYDLRALLQIIKIIKAVKPFLIHSHSAKGGFIGRLSARVCSIKAIYTPNGLAYLSFTGFRRIVYYLLEYIAKSWTYKVVAVSYSEANRAYLELGYNYEKVCVIPNSINIKSQNPRKYPTVHNIGMIARLTYQKNPLMFLRIANKIIQKYNSISFSILGAGLHDHLAKEVYTYIKTHKLEDKIIILPWGNNNTSEEFLKNTDIFLMTSAFEGLPYSLIEAMLEGIPCVVSKVDGNSDVIQNNENGFSCLSIDEYCEKLSLLIQDENLRRFIGQNGREYIILKHNVKINLQKLKLIYQSD